MGRRDYSPKRRDDRKPSSSSSRREEVSKMKEKMRSGFEGSSSSTREEYTHSSEVLDKFETSGFQPASFRSGERGNKKETAKEKAQNSHESAIFGPAWKSAEQMKKIEAKQGLVENIPMPIKTHVPLINANMLSDNTEKRKKIWFDYWKETRQQLLSSQ